MYRFITGRPDADLPTQTLKFHGLHSSVSGGGQQSQNPFSTVRNSALEWEEWRSDKSLEAYLNLPDIERECRESLDRLGYLPMGTLDNVRNLTKDIIADIDCEYLNCHTFTL